jgi:hypothetical protein
LTARLALRRATAIGPPPSGKVSRDLAKSWSDAFPLVSDEGMMVCNRPIVLHNGDYLLPLYHETGNDTEMTAPDSCVLFLRYDVRKKQWKQTGRIRSVTGNIQPVPVQLAENHLVAYIRRGGNRTHHQRLHFRANPATAADLSSFHR